MANSEPLAQAYADHLRRDRRRSVHTVRAYQAAVEWRIALLALQLDKGLIDAFYARELSIVPCFLKFATEGQVVPALKSLLVKRGASMRSVCSHCAGWLLVLLNSAGPILQSVAEEGHEHNIIAG